MKELFIKSLVSEFSKEIIKGSSGTLENTADEVKQLFDNGLTQYLEKQKTKYAYVKTLIHRSSPVYFYHIYQPLRITCNSFSISTESINHVFKQTQFITIIGQAGSGKSTLVKHLFLNSIKERFCIPILIELRYLNNYQGSIEDYIIEKIFEKKLAKNRKILERLLVNGKFVFFLDGYDEIKSTEKNLTVEKLNFFVEKYDLNRYLLTSRPYSNIELLPLFHNYRIENLNEQEINQFILKQQAKRESAEKIIASINENENEYIKVYFTNPLYLSLYIITFSYFPSVPKKKHLFYRRVVDALFLDHDKLTKVGFEREFQTKLDQEEFEEILKIFSIITFFQQNFAFTKDSLNEAFELTKSKLDSISFSVNDLIYDLKSSLSILIEDGGTHLFIHRSIQEYFAALYIQGSKVNKEVVYERLFNNLFGKHRLRTRKEAYNFLSLISEMDYYNYRKFMLLPSLKHIQAKIDNSNNRTILSDFLSYFFHSFDFFIHKQDKSTELTESTSHGRNMESLFYEYAVQDLIKEILEYFPSKLCTVEGIRTFIEKKYAPKVSEAKNVVTEYYHVLIEDLLVDDKGMELLLQSPLLKISKGFVESLNNRIVKIEKEVEREEDKERDIFDLFSDG